MLDRRSRCSSNFACACSPAKRTSLRSRHRRCKLVRPRAHLFAQISILLDFSAYSSACTRALRPLYRAGEAESRRVIRANVAMMLAGVLRLGCKRAADTHSSTLGALCCLSRRRRQSRAHARAAGSVALQPRDGSCNTNTQLVLTSRVCPISRYFGRLFNTYT